VALFRYYLNKVKHDAEIDVGRLARKSVYKTPADVMNIVKEAALIATRNEHQQVVYKDISEAIERIDLGIAHPVNMTVGERQTVAYHETGHMMVLYQMHPTDDVFKASIISRGGALGVVHHQPREEFHTHSRDKLLADIKVALGGFMAEKIKNGVTSSGVSSDFTAATRLAHLMVWSLGMGTNGFVGDFNSIPKNQLSEDLKKHLNAFPISDNIFGQTGSLWKPLYY